MKLEIVLEKGLGCLSWSGACWGGSGWGWRCSGKKLGEEGGGMREFGERLTAWVVEIMHF